MPSALLFLFLCVLSLPAQSFSVRVESSSAPHAVINLSVPENFPEHSLLRSGALEIPAQKLSPTQALFVIPRLESAQNFSVHPDKPKAFLRAALEQGKVTLTAGDQSLLVYQGHESEPPRPGINPLFKRGGYIHPLYTPSGKLVTDDYPPNHIHHHGIWFPWTKTVFEGREPDFWNMGQGKGKVEFVSFGSTWSGPVHAGFSAQHRFFDLIATPPKAALNETWQVIAYRTPSAAPFWIFDLVSTQTCASASPLILPKFHYGGLGFRGHWDWNGPTNTLFLTSNGETNRLNGNETRGRWCYIGGLVQGQQAGVAILGHPDNFRAPQPMRLHPNEPFFCFAPSQLGDWSIQPELPYISRYRFLVLDGEPSSELLQATWEAYAHPPKAQLLQH